MKAKEIYKALIAIDDTYKFEIRGDGKLFWQDEREQPTKEQIEAKIKELELEEKVKSIETKTTSFIKGLLDEFDYDNEGEVALYASNINSKWHKEAKALQIYIETIYIQMYELQDNIRNGENIDLDTIKSNYPSFSIND